MRFLLVHAAKKDLPVARSCEILDVSPSGYYGWKNRPASARQRKDRVPLAHVRSAFMLWRKTYGSPRLAHKLAKRRLLDDRLRVARLMRWNELKARRPSGLWPTGRWGDRSARVMQVLSEFTPDLEVYSIDEAWLWLAGFSDPECHGRGLRATVAR